MSANVFLKSLKSVEKENRSEHSFRLVKCDAEKPEPLILRTVTCQLPQTALKLQEHRVKCGSKEQETTLIKRSWYEFSQSESQL